MTNVLPPWPLLAAFVAASVVLAVTPGPGVLYIVTRSLSQGRRSGLASVAGVAAGNLGNALAASLGLAALFALSSVAFTVVKLLGALYLVWLGVQTLRRRTPAAASADASAHAALRRVFADGFLVALLNPKTAIFFAAFLPQFVVGPVTPVQTAALGALFVAIAALTDSAYALGAHATRRWVSGGATLARFGRLVTAAVFIGLGVLTALSGSRVRP